MDDIDYTAAATLRSLYALLVKQGIRLIFFEVSDEVYAQLQRSGITALVGKDAFFANGGAVLRAYKATQGAPIADESRLGDRDKQDNGRTEKGSKNSF